MKSFGNGLTRYELPTSLYKKGRDNSHSAFFAICGELMG